MTELKAGLVVLTLLAAALVGVLVITLLRIVARTRSAKGRSSNAAAHTVLLSAALQGAVEKLKTQEQVMTAKAAASDELRGKIADSLTAGLLVVDDGGRVELLNPAGQRLLELNREPIGVPYAEALAVAAPLADVIAECVADGTPIVRRSIEVPGEVKSTYYGVTVSPLATAAGAGGVICLFSDLTNVVELEEQLRLKETLARLGELTAGIAHEFRNGLATIHGFSRLLVPEALPPQYRPYLEAIRQETEMLGKVVTNFLNFAKPELMVFAPVDLGPLAQRAADDVKNELPAGTTVVLRGEFGAIDGDEVLLRQVFGNLLRNAAEACATIGVTPVIAVHGTVDRPHRTCRISVDDNGPGIPPAQRETVFRPFFTTRAQGTGLGLAVVQKIVVTHQGRVAVGASPEGGASIQLTFQLR